MRRPGGVTARNQEILRLLGEGLSDGRIAQMLGLKRTQVQGAIQYMRERQGVEIPKRRPGRRSGPERLVYEKRPPDALDRALAL